MKDRTFYYSEVVAVNKKESLNRKNLLIKRLEEYKSTNSGLFSSDDGVFSYAYFVLVNYLENRVCEYKYTPNCTACDRMIYFCGVNCKLCGRWKCSICTVFYDGVIVCRECKRIIEGKREREGGERTSSEFKEFSILKDCLRNPSVEKMKILSELVSELEGVEGVRKNVLTRAKIGICEFYAYKAKEERYSILIEQLKYLEGVKEKGSPVEDAIKEILLEIGEE